MSQLNRDIDFILETLRVIASRPVKVLSFITPGFTDIESSEQLRARAGEVLTNMAREGLGMAPARTYEYKHLYFQETDGWEKLLEALDRYGAQGWRLKGEITETSYENAWDSYSALLERET